MAILVPENVIKKVDSLGRVTLPKGLRDRMYLVDGDELEIFTANLDGRQCVCLSRPQDTAETIQNAITLLEESGYTVTKEN